MEEKRSIKSKRNSWAEQKNRKIFRENILRRKRQNLLDRGSSPKLLGGLHFPYSTNSLHSDFSSEISAEEEFISKNKFMMTILGLLNRLSNKFEFLLKANNESIKMMANFNQKLGKIDQKVLYGGKRANLLW